ncbi:MAG: hypothetical protein JWN70_6550 [Planctomycetaceae bacterium]|nr:hypothetical protein [Planctomycetaceae bacterium]
MTRRKKGILVGIGLLAIFLFPEVILPLCYHLIIGWWGFLNRVIPQIRWDPEGCTVGLLALCGLIAGGHLLILSFLRQRQTWQLDPDDSPSTIAPTTSTEIASDLAPPTDVAVDPREASWKPKHTLLMVSLIVTFCTVSILATSSAHATFWFVRSDPPTWKIESRFWTHAQSRTHLQRLGRALANYESDHSRFPAGGTFTADGIQGASWMTQLLPYTDQAELFKQIRFTEPWNSPHNAQLAKREVIEFSYHAAPRKSSPENYALAAFAANQNIMGANSSCRIRDILDGTSHTITAGQVSNLHRPWADPRNFCDVDLGINRSPRGFGGHRSDGAVMLFADGHVHFISDKIDPKVLRALATPRGGEGIQDGY